VVEPEGGEHRQLAQRHERERLPEQVLVATRDAGIEAQHVRHRVGERDEAGVDQDLRGPARRH
jgi:hypothetical protein